MFSSPAYAQAAAAPGGLQGSLLLFLPYVAIFAIFYFLMIRPQQQRAKAHRASIDAVKRGDEVVTSGGLIGKVTKVADAELEVEVATGVKLRVVKGMLSEVRTKPLPAAANDAKN
jgi:preprotein translocase subunit YajC